MGRAPVTRRTFFQTLAALVAGWFTLKPTTTLSAAPPGSPTSLVTEGWSDGPTLQPGDKFRIDHVFNRGQYYSYMDGEHRFHVWPNPGPSRTFFFDQHGVWEMGPDAIRLQTKPFAFPALNFHKHAFALVSDPIEITPDAPFTTEPSGNIGRIMHTYDPKLGDPRIMKLGAKMNHELAGDFARDAYDVGSGQKTDHLVASAEEIERAFDELNGMIDRWSREPWHNR